MAELDGRTSRSMRGIVDVQLVAKLKRLRSRASRHGDQWVKEAEDTTADASYGFIRANAEAVGFHNVLRELEERSRKPESEAAAVGERLLDELLEASATSDGVTEDSSQEHCDDQDEGEEDDDAVVLPQAEVASMIAQFSETSRENKIEAVKSLPRAKVISFVKLSLIARQRAKSTLGKIEEDKEDKSASEEKNAVESAQLEEVFRHVQNDSPDEAVAYLKSLPKATSDEAVRIVALARINTRKRERGEAKKARCPTYITETTRHLKGISRRSGVDGRQQAWIKRRD
eukprot:TRINITY_DN4513_c0_g1_i1.p1 TRINITY_DN4513_c0_g1~~TRINITY_DN4513_c0_g1_i1.p1  ORF type:complete len:306 (+),score=50.53 TRINITY_DN4513_c0_g1_i1:60-920(+)